MSKVRVEQESNVKVFSFLELLRLPSLLFLFDWRHSDLVARGPFPGKRGNDIGLAPLDGSIDPVPEIVGSGYKIVVTLSFRNISYCAVNRPILSHSLDDPFFSHMIEGMAS